VAAVLRRRRWRTAVRAHPGGIWTVSAEKGYLKETGNLLFHAALVAVLVGVALGGWYGWHGNRLVVAGPETGFCNVLAQYDEYGTGYGVRGAELSSPFCFTLDEFEASYLESGVAESFLVRGTLDAAAGQPRPVRFTVNAPLRLDGGASMYLLGHGYAPVLRYTDRYGQRLTTVAPFLPVDAMGSAEGVATFPDANVDPDTGERDRSLQVAFEGLYLPTATQRPFVASTHPQERAPVLLLFAYRGDLGIDDGRPQSVYTLNRANVESGALARVGAAELLRPGGTMTLDDGSTLEFLGTREWITVSVRHDPGQPIALAGAGLALAGLVLSLVGRRRRVWLRITAGAGGAGGAAGPGDAEAGTANGGASTAEAGALPRTDQPGLAAEFAALIAALPLAGPAPTRQRDAAPQPIAARSD
jgi:cytochrome c biogenesis protein